MRFLAFIFCAFIATSSMGATIHLNAGEKHYFKDPTIEFTIAETDSTGNVSFGLESARRAPDGSFEDPFVLFEWSTPLNKIGVDFSSCMWQSAPGIYANILRAHFKTDLLIGAKRDLTTGKFSMSFGDDLIEIGQPFHYDAQGWSLFFITAEMDLDLKTPNH